MTNIMILLWLGISLGLLAAEGGILIADAFTARKEEEKAADSYSGYRHHPNR